jgi:hypothetical protein
MEYGCSFEPCNPLSEMAYLYFYVHKLPLLFAYPWIRSKVLELDPRFLGRMEKICFESIIIIMDLAPVGGGCS